MNIKKKKRKKKQGSWTEPWSSTKFRDWAGRAWEGEQGRTSKPY